MKHVSVYTTIIVVVLTLFISTAQATTYEYDNQHRLTKVTYDDGTQVIYTYDAAGNRMTKRVVVEVISESRMN
jgi:YD repeat-containing protein